MNIYISIYVCTDEEYTVTTTDYPPKSELCFSIRKNMRKITRKRIGKKSLYLAVNPNNNTPTTKSPELPMLPSGDPYGS